MYSIPANDSNMLLLKIAVVAKSVIALKLYNAYSVQLIAY